MRVKEISRRINKDGYGTAIGYVEYGFDSKSYPAAWYVTPNTTHETDIELHDLLWMRDIQDSIQKSQIEILIESLQTETKS